MIADPGETAELKAALDELDLDLDELGQVFGVENDRARLALERLEGDSGELDRLDGMLVEWRDEVDVFDALSLHGDEQFHSNLLAWLLDPRGSHGLGDQFLQGFFAASGASRAIRAADRPSTIVRREKSLELDGEYGRLDIWMLNVGANFVCAVENKVWASEGEGQLAWYRRVLDQDHHDQRVHLVFLTPQGVRPDDPAEREHWRTMSYTDILRLVEGTMAAAGDTAKGDVLALLRQYAITLRRNIVPEVSNDVHELARRIYRKHRQAIDLIIEHRERYEPNYVSEAYRMILESVDERPELTRGTSNLPYARFLSTDWAEYGDVHLAEWPNWLLFFQVPVRERTTQMSLYLYQGGNERLRRKIFDCVKRNPDVFNCDVERYTGGDITLHTVGLILEESDYDIRWDEEETKNRIRKRLRDFAEGDFVRINEIITGCLDGYASDSR